MRRQRSPTGRSPTPSARRCSKATSAGSMSGARTRSCSRISPAGACSGSPRPCTRSASRAPAIPTSEGKSTIMSAFKQLGVAADHVNRHPAMRQEVINVHPNAKFHDAGHRIGEDELIAFLKDCDAAIIGFEPVTERVLSALPNLKTISKHGNGCETFDFQAMKRHGVRFGYTWGVNKLAVAELALGFMLMGLRFVMPLNVAMRAGERPRLRNGRFLTGRVVGIHGCGNIGKEIVRLLQPFGCKIIACRGGIVDEDALLECLDSGALTAACFDLFAVEPAENDRLLRHPNMLATPHIGASTEETRLILVRAAIHGLTNAAVVEPEQFYGV